jgi:NAD(P)-dependent dehydrogenase (short-subunit alcohol dehydrogenase family)
VTIDLSHRRILVTGAAQGLGLGIARRLASSGAALLLTDVDARVRAHLEDPVFKRSVAVVRDLAEPQAPEQIMQEAVAHFSSLDGLINCAGWSLQRPLAEQGLEEFDRLIAVNQRAPFFLCQQFVAQLTDRDTDPCIINIASVNAMIGNARLVAYAGTKGALLAMTRALAVELAPRVRVIAISPAGVRTEFTEQMIREGTFDAEASRRKRLIPRWIEVEEIGSLVVFLMSPAARSVTGSNWTFDGGYTAQ